MIFNSYKKLKVYVISSACKNKLSFVIVPLKDKIFKEGYKIGSNKWAFCALGGTSWQVQNNNKLN